jgi:hypothetical protein
MAADVANRLSRVDAQGVLRWQDNGDEVALFGVNYYPPFWHNYPDLKAVGADHKKVIDQDVAHFARLGLDALRLHVFDREVSDREGNLLDNEHLELLDYLILRAGERGIFTVLTPIAWWPVPGDSPGFSTRFTMQQMTTDRASWKPQANYLVQFAQHVNRFTRMSYRDDPAVVAFEPINEPLYPPDTTDAQVTDYINTLADALRSTGNRKPVFYNGWQGRLGCVRDARVDGSTFGWYPSGLVAGRSLTRNFLPQVEEYGGSNPWNPSMRHAAIADKAKIVYEFDAADIPGSYIYPAMARSFRAGGAQIATQFQYDPLPLAPFNQGWQTHYLNLVYAPQKAVSFLIAAEAFRRLPRHQDYGNHPQSNRFGPFRVSYEEDLSELVTEREFFHSNFTRTEPPAPGKLERIIGCGSSPVVRYEGTGAYFIEKLAPGAWRLEVYPDAVWVNDPYGAHSLSREVSRLIWRTWPMDIRLKDLGSGFSVEPLNAGNTFEPSARAGSFALRPGVYLLRRPGVPEETRDALAELGILGESRGHLPLTPSLSPTGGEGARRAGEGEQGGRLPKALRTITGPPENVRLAARVGLREFIVPPAREAPAVVRHEPRSTWVEGKPLPLEFTLATAQEPDAVELRVNPGESGSRLLPLKRERAYRYSGTVPGGWLKPGHIFYFLNLRVGGVITTFPTNAGDKSSTWSVAVLASNAPAPLFDAARHKVRAQGDMPNRQSLVPGMSGGRRALRIAVEKFGPPPSSISLRTDVSEELEPWREVLAGHTTLCLRVRALEPTTTAIEVVVLERDGSPWGTNVPLKTEWQEIHVPLASLRHWAHWGGTPPGRGGQGDRVRPQELAGVSVCFGAWLYPGHTAEPHTVEVEGITVE